MLISGAGVAVAVGSGVAVGGGVAVMVGMGVRAGAHAASRANTMMIERMRVVVFMGLPRGVRVWSQVGFPPAVNYIHIWYGAGHRLVPPISNLKCQISNFLPP